MIVPPLWAFAIGTLAAWRVWYLLAEDEILVRPRDWIEDRSKFAEKLLACPYCSGFWVSFLGTLGYYLVGPGVDVYGLLVTAFAMAITIIGIPLALANLKLIPVSLMPLGKMIVPVDEARVPA